MRLVAFTLLLVSLLGAAPLLATSEAADVCCAEEPRTALAEEQSAPCCCAPADQQPAEHDPADEHPGDCPGDCDCPRPCCSTVRVLAVDANPGESAPVHAPREPASMTPQALHSTDVGLTLLRPPRR
jgi:hypothetical protein